MAVLCEALSVIIPTQTVEEKFTGERKGFHESIPNRTYCSDGELERVGFLTPDDVGEFIDVLKDGGLTLLKNKECIDFCVIDMNQGPTAKCDWIEFHKISFGEGKVPIAWLFEGERIAGDGVYLNPEKPLKLYTPPGWKYENSISDKHQFVPLDEIH